MDERWNAESILEVAAEPRCPHPRMSESTSALTHGQAQTLTADGDPESDKEEEVVEGQFAEAEQERRGDRPAPDDEDMAASGEKIDPTEEHVE